MIELRWLRRNTGNRTLNQYGFFQDETEQVLQFRQKVDVTVYAGMGPFPESWQNMQWSDWTDVPVLDQTKVMATSALNACAKCGLDFSGGHSLGFVCSNNPCPAGLGSSAS